MYIDNTNHTVVIDDKFIYDTLANSNTIQCETCEQLIKSVCMAWSQNKEAGDSNINELRRVIDNMDTRNVQIMDTRNDQIIKTLSNHFNNHQIQMKDLIQTTCPKLDLNMFNTILNDKHALLMSQMKEMLRDLSVQNQKPVETPVSLGIKGEEGLRTELEECMTSRDGYRIQKLSNVPYSCDIEIKLKDLNIINLEVKNYTHKVQAKEVKKFSRDLELLGNNGIFVSLKSGIVGKNDFALEPLMNGKFAIYLSNNNYNAHQIREFVQLFYRLDDVSKTQGPGTISPEKVIAISKYINDTMGSIKQDIIQLDNVKKSLQKIKLSYIYQLISGDNTHLLTETFQCDICNKKFKTRNRLTKHKKNPPNNCKQL